MVYHIKIEEKWQKKWQDLGNCEPSSKKKFFMIFAYPGISGFLHVGHMKGYSLTDMLCRYKRMNNFEVLFPVGTHASGNQALAFAKKIQNKDQNWMDYLHNNGCPKDLIPTLDSADKIIDYFNNVYINDYWKRFGFICDWRRFTSTSHKDYNKFIQWQFKKLLDKNLLTQKPYFGTFCPECGPVAVDPSETDISKGGNAEKQEFTLLKFGFGDSVLVAATLRPETVFGQTNLWIDPNGSYVKVKVENENWIMSGPAAEKLAYQKDDVQVLDKVDPNEMIGKYALAPAIDREIIILPSSFVNPHTGSGIVTSVPSDAPYDYIALEDIKKNTQLQKEYSLPNLKDVIPIPIIKTQGYGDFPAIEICKKFNIQSQEDTEKLEEATKEIYKAGFHTGIMMESCQDFVGKKVIEAKELIKQNLIEQGKADIMHDLSEDVICRCQTSVIIKRIDDQWFVKYSNQDLTNHSKDHAKDMTIFPEEYAKNIPNVLDWFLDRACARLGNWTGSKLPFDDKWIVEPISDSTLYPIYYLVSKYVNEKRINESQLTESFFDFVFLNKGDVKEVANESGIKEEILNQIKSDVEYFYPLDINLGGKEHQTVHFPVFLMNHVGILDKKYWPKGIIVNWWVTGKGSKISKSKGGAEPIPGAIDRYSVDGLRLYYAHVGSPFVDVVWDTDIVYNYKSTIDRIYKLSEELFSIKDSQEKSIDKWLVTKIKSLIPKITDSFENFEIRKGATEIYFTIYDAFRWYQRRGGNNKDVIKEALLIWSKLLCPVTPHLAEELNSKYKQELVSTASWPIVDESTLSLEPDAIESMFEQIIVDAKNVFELSKIDNPKELSIFLADSWKYDLFTVLRKELNITKNVGELMKRALENDDLKKQGKGVSKIVQSVAKDPSKVPDMVLSQEKEFLALTESKSFLESELNVKILILKSEDSTENKSKAGMPGKPALLVK